MTTIKTVESAGQPVGRARISLGVALSLLAAAALAVVLATGPPTVLASNGVLPTGQLAIVSKKGVQACQSSESVPRGTRAVRISLEAFTGPEMWVTISSAGRLITSGERASGWGGRIVTIPLKRVAHTAYPAKVCFRTGRTNEHVLLLAQAVPLTEGLLANGNEAIGGRLRLEYVGAPRSSWLANTRAIARYMGLGRAWPGSWVAAVVLLMMLASAGLASRLALGALRG